MTRDQTTPVGEARPVLRRASDQFAELKEELDGYYARFKRFYAMSPTDVMLELSAIAARLIEIRGGLMRRDADRIYKAFRTGEIDPLLDQCEFQFKLHSRVVAVYATEAELAR